MKSTFMVLLLSFTLISLALIPKTHQYNFPELSFFPSMPLPKNNPVTVEGVNLGRYLFYDKILSDDSTISCNSCHKQEFAFSDSPNKFSIGKNNIPMNRNTLPLYNLAWYNAFFWDGRASTIENQIFHPVREKTEMNLPWKFVEIRLNKSKFYKGLFKKAFGTSIIDSVNISKAIGQFLRTLISYQSKFDKVLARKENFTADEYDGFVLMNDQTKGDCIHCHPTDGAVLATTLKFSNNGLDEVLDFDGFKDNGFGTTAGLKNENGKFKIPSLRNLSYTAPYMHDGRFKSLEEVLEFYSTGVKKSVTLDSKMEFAHQGGNKLTDLEKKKIITFLYTLNDSIFVSELNYKNPFK